MGLKKKVGEIATQAAQQAVETIAPTLVQQIVQTNNPYTTKIVRSTGQNTYVVKDQMGNETTVTYTGDRPVGPGGSIVVQGQYAR